MTREKAKQLLPVLQAFADGKAIQFRHEGGTNGEWWDGNDECFSFDNFEYRVKPEPKLRAWRPEEVPVGALTKFAAPSEKNYGVVAMIVGVSPLEGIRTALRFVPFDCASNFLSHSTDGGKTWLPCGVLEEAQ